MDAQRNVEFIGQDITLLAKAMWCIVCAIIAMRTIVLKCGPIL